MILDLTPEEVAVVGCALNAYWGPREAQTSSGRGPSPEVLKRWRREADIAEAVMRRLQ